MTGPLNAPAPADRPSPYAPSAAPAPARRRPWGAAILGVVVGLVIAVAVGAILVATKALHLGALPAATSSSAAITLPATVGGLNDYLTANQTVLSTSSLAADRKAAILSGQQAHLDTVRTLTVAAYQKANPGAAVAFRSYASADLQHFASVIAVRNVSPGLTMGPVTDIAYLQVAVPQLQVKTFGDVQCLIGQDEVTQASAPVDPAHDITSMCQRTGAALTVQVWGGGFRGATDEQQMVTLTNAAWTSVSG